MSLQGIKIYDIPQDTNKLGEYTLGRKLGQGATATVWEAKLKSDTSGRYRYAMKCMKVPEVWHDFSDLSELKKIIEPVLTEYRIIKHIHDSAKANNGRVAVVPIHEVIVSHNEGRNIQVWLVMDKFVSDAGQAGPRRYPQDNDLVRKWLTDALQTLKILKDLKIVHRDIKPQNLLISDTGDIYFSDFGTVCDMQRVIAKRCSEYRTTFAYADPLMFKNHLATFESDLYALGYSFVAIANGIGYHPTKNENQEIMDLTSNSDNTAKNPFDEGKGPRYERVQKSIFDRIASRKPSGMDQRLWDCILAMIDRRPNQQIVEVEDILAMLSGTAKRIYFFVRGDPIPTGTMALSAGTGNPLDNDWRLKAYVESSIERCIGDPTLEFEARMPQVKSAKFYKILESFRKFRLPFRESTEVDVSLKDGRRVTFKSLSDLERYIFDLDTSIDFTSIRKDRISKYDSDDYGVRFHLARERAMQAFDFDMRDVTVVREKNRMSFNYKDTIRYDFTVVNSYEITNHGDLHFFERTFEIELELISVSATQDTGATLLNKVYSTLQFVQDSQYVMTSRDYARLRRSLTELTGQPRIVGPQPHTFHREHLGSMKEGSLGVTVKKDGERQLLAVFENNGETHFVGIDRNQDIRLFAVEPKLPSRIKNTVVDAERMSDSTIYVFDILIDNGLDLRDKTQYTLPERMKRLTKWFELLTPSVTERLKFKLKKHFYGNEAKDFIKSYFRNESLRKNSDGLIFTPMNDPYPKTPSRTKILKWKPKEQLTIDFMLESDRHGQRLSVIDSRDVYVVFQPESRLVERVDLPDKLIVECAWDYTAKRWRVVKPRYDKTRPNFVTVARDVWKAIENPANAEDLII